jgi:8-amino-7-oxononanoate synthase
MGSMPCRIEPASPARQAAPAAADLVRPRRLRTGKQGATVILDGRELVNFGANDYLGYAGDVRLSKAASKAACSEGFGAGASPLVSGHSQTHDNLERALADLVGVEASLVFPSGFAANSATIPALAGPDDAIYSDDCNHASLIDGCRLSRAEVRIYPHRDLSALEALLAHSTARRKLIVSDSLFSMDGTIAPLADLCELARRHGAILMVDEAHATGVFGKRGSGLVEQSGCEDGVHVRIGTLSKALGAAGGFVAGHRRLVDWLRHKARAWVFSTAHPPAVAAAATRAIELVHREPERRHDLLERAAAFRMALTARGLQIGGAAAQIVPVVAGEPAAAVARSARLAEAGFFVPAIRPPSVPPGKSLVRASLSWLHTESDLARLADALAG